MAGAACVFNLHEGRASKPVLRLVVDRGEEVLQVAYGLTLVTLKACAYCHGGLVAHNIDYHMVSHWERTGFRSI